MSASQNGNEQLPALGKMVLQKMEELRQLDSRIDKRLEHLNRADANLRVLFDSLRSSILQAHPLIGQMNDLRQGTAGMLENLVAEVKSRIAADPEMMKSAEPDLSAIDRAVAVGVAKIDHRAQVVDGDINVMVDTVKHFIDSAFANVRSTADESTRAMQSKLEEMQLVMAEATAQTASLAEKSSMAETNLDDAIAAFTAQADSTVAAVRRSVAQQVEQLAAQAKMDVRPILSKLDEQKQAAEAQLSTAAESAELALARRAEELKRNAERMIELCEQQLIDRISTIRPDRKSVV